MLDQKDHRIVRASSESTGNAKYAKNAIDGDPHSLWHTSFSGKKPAAHPHELLIDLGQSRTLKGVRYLARQDTGWNGTVGEFEILVSDSATVAGRRVASGTFQKKREPQQFDFEAACTGRYVLFRVLSEVNGGPWASVAELGLIGE